MEFLGRPPGNEDSSFWTCSCWGIHVFGGVRTISIFIGYPKLNMDFWFICIISFPHGGFSQPSRREIGQAFEQANIARGARRWRKWTKLRQTTAIITASALANASIYKSLDGCSLVLSVELFLSKGWSTKSLVMDLNRTNKRKQIIQIQVLRLAPTKWWWFSMVQSIL